MEPKDKVEVKNFDHSFLKTFSDEEQQGKLSGREVMHKKERDFFEKVYTQFEKLSPLPENQKWGTWLWNKVAPKTMESVSNVAVSENQVETCLNSLAILLGEEVPEDVKDSLMSSLRQPKTYNAFVEFLTESWKVRKRTLVLLKNDIEVQNEELNKWAKDKEKFIATLAEDEAPILEVFIGKKLMQRVAPDNTQLFLDSFRFAIPSFQSEKKFSGPEARRLTHLKSALEDQTLSPAQKQLVEMHYFRYSNQWWKADWLPGSLDKAKICVCGKAFSEKELHEVDIVFDLSPILNLNKLNRSQVECVFNFIQSCASVTSRERLDLVVRDEVSNSLLSCMNEEDTKDLSLQLRLMKLFLDECKGLEDLAQIQKLFQQHSRTWPLPVDGEFYKMIPEILKGNQSLDSLQLKLMGAFLKECESLSDPELVRKVYEKYQKQWPIKVNFEKLVDGGNKYLPVIKHSEELIGYAQDFKHQVRVKTSKLAMVLGDPTTSFLDVKTKIYEPEDGQFYPHLPKDDILYQMTQLVGLEKLSDNGIQEMLSLFLKNGEFVNCLSQFLATCELAKMKNEEMVAAQKTITREESHNLAIAESAIPLLSLIEGIRSQVDSKIIEDCYRLISILKNSTLPKV